MFTTVLSRRVTAVTTSVRGFKVAVLGAGGGIGQPLSLLLKLNPKIKQLALYDVARTAGVGADISHCCTPGQIKAYTGPEEINGVTTVSVLHYCELLILRFYI